MSELCVVWLICAFTCFQEVEITLEIISSSGCGFLLSSVSLTCSSGFLVHIDLLFTVIVRTLEDTLVELISEAITSSYSFVLAHVTIV
jgi:hypothetical protein